jgi:diguanylate cyclase (GGDEF)-like protein
MLIIRRFSEARWWPRLLVAVASISLVCGAALALLTSQASAHREVAQRWTAKAGLSADFAGTYVTQLTSREQLVASRTLTRSHPAAAFASDVGGFGFPAAVLLDARGRALAVAPPAPQLIGTQIAAKYAHLTAALHGHIAVSNMVLSAAKATPVVAFAVPFRTPQGLRVFSGAYAIGDTPLAAYLNDARSLTGERSYLIDGNGVILATNGQLPDGQTLAQRDPILSRAASKARNGDYTSRSNGYAFAEADVPGTPWRLIVTAPSSQLFASNDGTAHVLPWLILGCLSLLLALAGFLAVRLFEGRRRIADANKLLADTNKLLVTIARTDRLTGLPNRLHLTEQLETLLANATRHRFAVCVLMIDVDFFKQINDRFGHAAGDDALRQISQRLLAALREGDLLARWGGEEFLAVLPYSDLTQSLEVAGRLCRLISAQPITLATNNEPVTIQVSVGVASAMADNLDALVHRADLGLYQAKAAGRNTARTVTPATVPGPKTVDTEPLLERSLGS